MAEFVDIIGQDCPDAATRLRKDARKIAWVGWGIWLALGIYIELIDPESFFMAMFVLTGFVWLIIQQKQQLFWEEAYLYLKGTQATAEITHKERDHSVVWCKGWVVYFTYEDEKNIRYHHFELLPKRSKIAALGDGVTQADILYDPHSPKRVCLFKRDRADYFRAS